MVDILDLWNDAYEKKSDHDDKLVLLLVPNDEEDNNVNNQLEQHSVDPFL